MKKLIKLLFFLSTVTIFNISNGEQVNYASFSSLEEVICFETSCISNIPAFQYEQLSDAYSSRGESFLLCNRFLNALEDFQHAYDLAISVRNTATSHSLIFRALFGQAIAYGNLNKPDMADLASKALINIISKIQCSECLQSELSRDFDFQDPLPILYCSNNNVPIYGPDEISIHDCIDFINNTVGFCKILIQKAPSNSRETLKFIIDQLAEETRRCCRAGGLWKGCFQKLGNKYHLWNEKWKMFGIPPDPSWD
ncbi:MAG: tetratricopeptide repeat protein [Chlamydiales bacterium]|nr:tetratricopeptide repeat protein [Chlamydiales bacterium]